MDHTTQQASKHRVEGHLQTVILALMVPFLGWMGVTVHTTAVGMGVTGTLVGQLVKQTDKDATQVSQALGMIRLDIRALKEDDNAQRIARVKIIERLNTIEKKVDANAVN